MVDFYNYSFVIIAEILIIIAFLLAIAWLYKTINKQKSEEF